MRKTVIGPNFHELWDGSRHKGSRRPRHPADVPTDDCLAIAQPGRGTLLAQAMLLLSALLVAYIAGAV